VTDFHFIVAVRNGGPWIRRCLDSLASQRDQRFVIHVTDDASEDDTVKEIQRFRIENPTVRIRPVANRLRMGAMYNQYNAIARAHADRRDVCVIVDGDDYLAHDNVLNVLARCYDHSSELVCTYGNYRSEPHSQTCIAPEPYPKVVAKDRDVRRWSLVNGIKVNHLRTFRAGAFMKIDPARNFCWPNGNWFRVCCDTAVMIPLLEMAWLHYRFIDEILYVYNSENPDSDWRQSAFEINQTNHYILGELSPVWTNGHR